MIDYTIKGKLRFNDPLTFNESHILYDCVDKLEKIEQIVEEWNNDTEKDIESFDTMERIKEVLEKE